MRIGLVIESFDPARGGAEHWTHQFAGRLLAAGHEVHVLARRFSDPAQLEIISHPLPGGRGRLAFGEAAEQAARSLCLDVVHDMGSGWHCDVFQPHGGSRLATFEQTLKLSPRWIQPLKRCAAPLLPRYREFRKLMHRQYSAEPLILALSKMVKRDLIYYHDVPPDRIRLVYNGVNVQRFSPDHRPQHRERTRERLGIRRDTVLLFIAAHNFRLKGVPTLLRALGRLVEQDHPVHLVVAGGKRFARYQKMAQHEGAGGAVTFLGSVRDVVPLYAAADVYVQPTFYDPCSLVALEALASGLPVVSTRLNGATELMTDGREGYLLDDPADDEELVARLLPLLDAQRRARMGDAARALALQRTLSRNCQEILNVYSETAAHKGLAA